MSKRSRNPQLPSHAAANGVAVAWMYAEDTKGMFTESLSNLLIHDGANHGYVCRYGSNVPLMGGPQVAAHRNKIVRQFLVTDSGSWLWFVDSDMVYEPETLDRLLAFADPVDRPVVGGLCFSGGWRTPLRPTMYHFDGPPIMDWLRGQPLQVDATGAGCLLIHRSVLEKMGAANIGHTPAPWFEDGVHMGDEVGEDIVFCMRLKHLGIPVWVHTDIRIGHIKPWVLDEALFDSQQSRGGD